MLEDAEKKGLITPGKVSICRMDQWKSEEIISPQQIRGNNKFDQRKTQLRTLFFPLVKH
jgi:hypothetical protein